MIGQSLSHFKITGKLGEGGMGEVYRAQDTKLGREVAIKVLPDAFVNDPDRLARFEREARVLASLNHPKIAGIHEVGEATVEVPESDGESPAPSSVHFLVMELAPGETLAERLDRGAVPFETARSIAVQIAEALEAAHEMGVVHRDLKPANIKLDRDDQVKVLDFGLAKAMGPADSEDGGPASRGLSLSPTLTAQMTQVGVLLGTAAYMSPEQAKGKPADKRADIWAYGVILWEMLTGVSLFGGKETAPEVLAAVLTHQPDLARLPDATPPAIRGLVGRCLDPDPRTRLRDIGEARIALARASADPGLDSGAERTERRGAARPIFRWVGIAAVAALALAIVSAWAALRGGAPPAPLIQSSLLSPEGWDFAPAAPFAISPDGGRIAYVAVAGPDHDEAGAKAIWIRDLAVPEPRRLVTVDGEGYPFWSPNGRWLAFFAHGKLNKTEARGGPTVPLCDATDGRGGSWNDAGTLIFQRAWSEGLMKVPAAGGTPVPLTTLNKERFDIAHRWPEFLPDGRHFLFYLVSTSNPIASEDSGIYVGSLDSDEPRFLMKSESRAAYSSGHLLFRVGSTLMARPFDASSQRFTGDAVPLATDVPGGAISWGGAHFGASPGGLLVHMRGVGVAHTQLSWRARDGAILAAVGDPSGYWEPRLAHDGTRLAVSLGLDAADIWILDLESGQRSRFTFHTADDRSAVWSPDDDRLAFASTREAQGEIYVRPTSGPGDVELLYTAGTQIALTDWSSDGRLILFSRTDPVDGRSSIWALDLESSEAHPVLTGEWFQDGRLSPDGRWLAYISDESGRQEVYVQSFPHARGRWMVSSDSGTSLASSPAWRRDGRELYYLRGATLMAVSLPSDMASSLGTPTPLFGMSVIFENGDYAASADGQRFLTNELLPADRGKIGARLIQNWTAALGR